jgi:4'-phosphopantetheinyl transferase
MSSALRDAGATIQALSGPPAADWRLWRIDLDALGGLELDACSADERAAAQRMRFPHLRRRALAARHALRLVLGQALGCDPREVVFRTGLLGKPALPQPSGLHFNLSHSEGLALVGLRESGPIGVDVEVLRPGAADPLVVQRLFSPAEQREWQAAAPPQRDAAFLSAWTRKEACVKALGVGLSLEGQAVDAGCAPSHRVVAVAVGSRTGAVQVCSVDPGMPALAAVATVEEDFALYACERLA